MVDVSMLLQQLRDALQFIGATLMLTGFLYPNPAVVQNGDCYDYIVVGGGTAGCIIAHRLAEDQNVRVLLIERGGDPPYESSLSGLFYLLPQTIYDYGYKSVPKPQIAQYTKNKAIELTAGKMLGGSSSLNHVILARSHPKDFDDWADIINNNAWNYNNILPYIKKPQNLVAEEILESKYARFYGRGGYITLTTDHEEVTDKYLEAFEEIGHKRKNNKQGILGYREPIFYISKDGVRQSTARTYLTRDKNRANLHVMKSTEVIKVIFDKCNNAKGVVARNETGEFVIYSSKEVIICAGALNTPKILMLSGIGPKKTLQKLRIKTISNLPVGKNLQDHTTVLFAYKMEPSNKTNIQRDPYKYPTPVVIGYDTIRKTQGVPDYQTSCLIFDRDTSSIPVLTSALFNYIEDIGETFYNASIGHEFLLISLSLLHPKTRGTVKAKSKNHDPLVYLNTLSNDQDLTNIARYLQNFAKIRYSSYFRRVGAEFVNLDVGCGRNDNSLKFWKCYAKALANTCWQYCGSCSLGAVVDADLKVKGVGRLRVADASVIPKITSGFLSVPVMAIAEKAADLIKGEGKR